MDRLLCIFFGVGLLRPAPGTWASAVAVLLGVQIHRIGHFPLLAALTIAVTYAGFRAVRSYTWGMSDPDRAEIVIDEVAGQWLALCFPSAAFFIVKMPSDIFPYPGWLAAFIFFRIFDIWKPWLVGQADREGGVDGVMKDDLWAGLFAGIATLILAAFAHLVLI